MQTVRTHGTEIPALGFGTFQMAGDEVVRMVSYALDTGYRHIDTAQAYGNEAEVGRGIAQSSVSRDDVWVTTKVDLDSFRSGDLERSVDESLRRLGLEAVDLVLLHWPVPDVPLEETLAALAKVYADGKTRSIGVSNFPSALFDEAYAMSDVPLVTNQVEYHPYLAQPSVLDAVRRAGSTLTAYSPLAQGAVLGDPVMREVAEAHDATVGQVALRWLTSQDDVLAIPKTATESRAVENLASLELSLSDEEIERIAGLARGHRVIDPPFAPEWDED